MSEAVYFPESDVTLSFDYGAGATVTALNVSVRDETDEEIHAASVALPGSGTVVSVTVAAAHNALPEGALSAFRSVYLVVQRGTAKSALNQTYVLEGRDKLVIMSNTFMTYGEAVLTRRGFPTLAGWDVADETLRTKALKAAFENMCRLSFRYSSIEDWQSLLTPYAGFSGGVEATEVTDMRTETAEDFADYPDFFKKALRRAQLVEADNLMGGDAVDKKRRDGIVSETIGESSIFLGTSRPIKSPICSAAMRELGGFLTKTNRIVRA